MQFPTIDLISLKDTLGKLHEELPPNLIKEFQLIRRERVNEPVITIGNSTCSEISGSKRTMQYLLNYLENNNITANIIETGCMGLCWLEPIMCIQLPGRRPLVFQKVCAERVDEILDAVFNNNVVSEFILGQIDLATSDEWEGIPHLHQLPFFEKQQRVLMKLSGHINPLSILEYIAHGGYSSFSKALATYTASDVCSIIERSKLRGLSGNGFPTGQKWRNALNSPSGQKYVICNAHEGDPGAFSTRTLIESNPHLLIEGTALAAYAIGAGKAIIFIRNDYHKAYQLLNKAIEDAKEAGFLGENILKSGYNLNIQLVKSAGAFVTGEETALINHLESKRAHPAIKPPYPTESGFQSKPTVVNNAETLAQIPGILQKGPHWFVSTGTKSSVGTKLFSISGKNVNTCVVEVPFGTTPRQLLETIGFPDESIKAIQLGGPIGSCVTTENLDIPIDFESLSEAGLSLGSGSFVILDHTACMVDIARYFIDFLQHESCGKCISCREGTRRMWEILDQVSSRPIQSESHESLERFKGIMTLESLAKVIKDTSLCGLGQKAASTVLQTLQYFREEYEEHIFERKCRSGVCQRLKLFKIDPVQCTGCNVCLRKCPENAIIGQIHQPHFIVEDKCTGCGICFEVCKFNAINTI